jgi:hypothetical protein
VRFASHYSRLLVTLGVTAVAYWFLDLRMPYAFPGGYLWAEQRPNGYRPLRWMCSACHFANVGQPAQG